MKRSARKCSSAMTSCGNASRMKPSRNSSQMIIRRISIKPSDDSSLSSSSSSALTLDFRFLFLSFFFCCRCIVAVKYWYFVNSQRIYLHKLFQLGFSEQNDSSKIIFGTLVIHSSAFDRIKSNFSQLRQSQSTMLKKKTKIFAWSVQKRTIINTHIWKWTKFTLNNISIMIADLPLLSG